MSAPAGLRGLLRGSGFVRLGGLVTLVFLVANAAAFLTALHLSNVDMEGRLRAALAREMAGLRTLARDEGPAAMAEELRERAAAAAPGEALHLIWPQGAGAPALGDARLPAPFTGFRDLTEADIAPTDAHAHPRAQADGYLALGDVVGGMPVVIARSTEARDEVVEIFSQAMLAGLGLSAVLAIGGTLWFLGRAERRVTGIGAALDGAAAGDLARRVPVSGTGDDLDRVAAAINAMLARLEDNVASLRQVSADIAHDLRTPLGRLRATLERMQDAPDPAATQEALAQVDGIVATFQALLRIAQIEGGGPRARFAPVDLGELCATLADLFGPEAEDQGHAFRLRLPGGPAPRIMGDRDLLAQMLSNLIENALRHAPPPAAITLSLSQRGDQAEIIVADSGPGIPPEERKRVFRRLYRLDRSRTTEGSGLGLSLVSAVVRLHEGEVRLEDADPGLKVVISAPRLD